MKSLIAAALLLATSFAAAPAAADDRAAMRQRLSRIVLPEVTFEDAPVKLVFKFLRQRAKELDPEREGINFFLRCQPASLERRVTIAFTEMPLAEVIRYICIGSGLDFRVESHAVVIMDAAPKESQATETRVYRVRPGVF